MKALKQLFLLLILLTAFCSYGYSKIVVSSEYGGLWSDANSWANGEVPEAQDTVVINSPIKADTAFKSKLLYVYSQGSLEIVKKNCIVENGIINYGSIVIRETGDLTANCIYQEGNLTNYSVINILNNEDCKKYHQD